MIEFLDHGAIGAFAREGADMGLEQHRFEPRPPAPVSGAPVVAGMIDHFARTGHVLGLKGGGRVRHVDLIVDPEFVARASFGVRNVDLEPAVPRARKRVASPLHQHIDPPGRRGPKAERGAVWRQPCAEMSFIHAEPEKTSTERGGAVVSLPDGNSAAVCLTSTVFNSCCQLLYSGTFGKVNVIASGAALSTMKSAGWPCSTGAST